MATKTTEAGATKFDAKKLTRNKCLGWDPKGNSGKGAGVYTSDLLNDDNTVNESKCKAFGVAPKEVVYLTINDLPDAYRRGARDAVNAYAKDQEMSPDDAVYELVLNAMLQRAANKSVASVRPVTDKSKERAMSTLRKVLESQGKSDAEITATLASLGMA